MQVHISVEGNRKSKLGMGLPFGVGLCYRYDCKLQLTLRNGLHKLLLEAWLRVRLVRDVRNLVSYVSCLSKSLAS